jgi:hypothetical protein
MRESKKAIFYLKIKLKIENIPIIRKLILCQADTKIIDTYGNNILKFAENSRPEVKEMLINHFNQLNSCFDYSFGIGLKPIVKSKTNFYLFIILHISIWLISFFCLLPCKYFFIYYFTNRSKFSTIYCGLSD